MLTARTKQLSTSSCWNSMGRITSRNLAPTQFLQCPWPAARRVRQRRRSLCTDTLQTCVVTLKLCCPYQRSMLSMVAHMLAISWPCKNSWSFPQVGPPACYCPIFWVTSMLFSSFMMHQNSWLFHFFWIDQWQWELSLQLLLPIKQESLWGLKTLYFLGVLFPWECGNYIG